MPADCLKLQARSATVSITGSTFITMRCDGRLIYALNVSNPSQLRLLWKYSSSDIGFGGLG
jgi:hypothetical protein